MIWRETRVCGRPVGGLTSGRRREIAAPDPNVTNWCRGPSPLVYGS